MSGGGDMINCTRIDHNTVQCDGKDYHLEELLGATDVQFWVYLIMYLVLVLFAGMVSYSPTYRLAPLVAPSPLPPPPPRTQG